MGVEAKPDFSGWASKAGLKCSDGRTILPGAFKHQDGVTVPLVWQHNHSSPENVLGYATLEHRDDGVYTYAFFNETPNGKHAKTLVHHKDVKFLSIYANELTERAKQVLHGMIREVSLVLAGANPGALIDNITLAHSDGEMVTLEDEAIIYTGLELSHSDDESDDTNDDTDNDTNDDDDSSEETNNTSDDNSDDSDDNNNDDGDDENISHQEVYNSLSDKQKELVNVMVGATLDNSTNNDLTHDDNNDKEGQEMGTHNVFETDNEDKTDGPVLSHSDIAGIVDDAKRIGSFKEAVNTYAVKHGIENIDVLFPEARNVTDTPEFMSRRIEWVQSVLNSTKKSPFSRIKSLVADITFPEARARGYIKGNFKKEEWFAVSKRKTTPATVYKKQRLDRDDIIDIVDFDVVVWLKAEMRMMFDEEIARAILIGDGRAVDDDDKIQDPAGSTEGAGIRSIMNDHDLYAPTFTVPADAEGTVVVDAITSAMGSYKGSGGATLYTTLPFLTSLLLTRDEFGHRLWRNSDELATEMGLSGIVTVEVMEDEPDLCGIIVNLRDYTIGTDKGGEVNFFDFFDIDYNQYKYLYESRLSGALTKIRSALVLKKATDEETLATPEKPDFDDTDITVPSTTGVIYMNGDDDVTGSTVSLGAGESATITAVPDDGYYFADNIHDQWTFKNNS